MALRGFRLCNCDISMSHMGATSRQKTLHNVNQTTQTKFFTRILIHRVLHKCYINLCFLSSCCHHYNMLLLIVSLLSTHYGEIYAYIRGKFWDHVYKHKDDAKTLVNEERRSLTARIIRKTWKSFKELWTLTSIPSGTPVIYFVWFAQRSTSSREQMIARFSRVIASVPEMFFQDNQLICLRNKYFAPF